MKESWNILQKDKELLMFPIFSGILSLILFASFIVPIVFAEMYSEANSVLGTPLLYLLIFVFYFLASIIVVYFNVALIACAKMRLEGKNPTLKDGFKAASGHWGKIIGWSALNATVGLLIRVIIDQIEERSPLLAGIVSGVLGAAWSILTFFVIPVMVFEGKGVFSSIKESGAMIKHTWGERLTAGFSMGMGFMLLYGIAAIPLLLGVFVSASTVGLIVGIGITVMLWIIIATVSTALNGVFIAALYHYVRTGKVEGFSGDEVKHAFVGKSKQ